MKCKIFLFRHAESKDNLRNMFSGWCNSPLAKIGFKSAEKIAKQLKNEKIDYAFTTTLSRAKRTLDSVLKYHPNAVVFIDDRIRERCYGILQDRDKALWERRHPEFHAEVHRGYWGVPPKGESVAMTARRTMNFLRQLLRFMKTHPGNVAISCHGNSMRPLRRHFEHLTIQEECMLENPHDQAMIYTVDVVPSKNSHRSEPDCWKSVILPRHVKLATDKHNILKNYY